MLNKRAEQLDIPQPPRFSSYITTRKKKVASTRPRSGRYFLCCLTSVITAQSMIIKVNKSPYVTMISATSLMRVGGRASCSAPLASILYCQCAWRESPQRWWIIRLLILENLGLFLSLGVAWDFG